MHVIFRLVKNSFWYSVIGIVQIVVFEIDRFLFPDNPLLVVCLIFAVSAVLYPLISIARQRVRF